MCKDLPPPKSLHNLSKNMINSTEKELILEIESHVRMLQNIKCPLPQSSHRILCVFLGGT